MFLNRALYVDSIVYIRKNKTQKHSLCLSFQGYQDWLLVVDKGAGGVKVRLQEELPGTSAQNQKVNAALASTYLAAQEDEAWLLWVAGTSCQPVSWGWGLMAPQVC